MKTITTKPMTTAKATKIFERNRRCHAIVEWNETIEAESEAAIKAGKYRVTKSEVEVDEVIETHEEGITYGEAQPGNNPIFADEDWVGDFDFEQLRGMLATNAKVDWNMQDAAQEFQAILDFIDNK